MLVQPVGNDELRKMKLSVVWQDAHRFMVTTQSGATSRVDGNAEAGVTPTEAALIAIATCMGIDIVDILTKGRQPPTACRIAASADRRDDPPRRFTSVRLIIDLEGEIDRRKAERAVQLSRDTYCSVWNSMAPDITLETEVRLAGE